MKDAIQNALLYLAYIAVWAFVALLVMTGGAGLFHLLRGV